MAFACSAVYLLNLRGDVLIYRAYRDDVNRNVIESFRDEILSDSERSDGTGPLRLLGSASFLYVRVENVYLVVVTQGNSNATLALKFMTDLAGVFRSYFGGECNDNAIRNNFVIIYELLDEVMDYGYPQTLDAETLKRYITQEGNKSENAKTAWQRAEEVRNATLQVTGAVPHRNEGLVYKKNEVFLDIKEEVNLLMSAKGTVLRTDVTGKLIMRCFLSGMPELRLGLNDVKVMEGAAGGGGGGGNSRQVDIDDIVFHQCVNLANFDSERAISLVPPDGEFELMRYRISDGIKLPFKVLPSIRELGRTRLEANVRIRSVYSDKLFAIVLKVKIPVPPTTARATINVTSGKAKYDAGQNALIWKVKRYPGQQEVSLDAEVEMVASTKENSKKWAKPPISLDFQVPMFTASGLRVMYLKVLEKSGYNVHRWVRYLCKSGSYDVRVGDNSGSASDSGRYDEQGPERAPGM